MGQVGRLRQGLHEGNEYLTFYCPGCKGAHTIKVRTDSGWTFNGNYDKPTFSPSVLVTGTELTDEEYDRILAGEKIEGRPTTCHSYVTDGRIQFLGDCTHELKNQTVDLPDLPDYLKD